MVRPYVLGQRCIVEDWDFGWQRGFAVRVGTRRQAVSLLWPPRGRFRWGVYAGIKERLKAWYRRQAVRGRRRLLRTKR